MRFIFCSKRMIYNFRNVWCNLRDTRVCSNWNIFASKKVFNENIMKEKKCIVTLLLGLVMTVSQPMKGQVTELTLRDCLIRAIECNLSMNIQRNEVESAKQGIAENRAKLLPQINGFANYGHNFEPVVSATDQSFAGGADYWITHTLPYSFSTGAQLSMPLYNQTLLTSQKLVKLVAEASGLKLQKAREDLMMNVCKMYYMAQVTTEQLRLIDDNIKQLTGLRDHTKAFQENGMVLEVDLQRVDLNLQNLQTASDNARLTLRQQYNTLKYVMNFPADAEIRVTSADIDALPQADATGISESLPELQLLHKSHEMAGKQLKMVKQGYLPSLSLTGFVQWSAWSKEFDRWFHQGPENDLWNAYGFGLSLRVPIFDGFDKRQKTRKAKLAVNSAQVKLEDSRAALDNQYRNAVMERDNAMRTYQQQKESYRLAEKVYQVTSDQYLEGVTTMTAVMQDQISINQARAAYVNAHLNYQLANLTIIKLTGQIEKLLQ